MEINNFNSVEIEKPKLDIKGINPALLKMEPINDLNNISKERDQLIMKLEPMHVLDNLEKEFDKVKDFDFRKVDVEDIKKSIKKI